MKGFNTPRKSQGRDLFYQTPTNCSDEEIQRNIEFLKKLQEADDKTLYRRYEGYITYIQLKRGLVLLLRGHRGLIIEFRQLLSYFASPVRNNSEKENPKSELKRTVAFLHKIEALGESVYKAFMDALGFSGDKEILIEQLSEMLRGHESLKEEFETFLIDNRLLKRKRDCVNVTPSYCIRPEVEKGSSSGPVHIIRRTQWRRTVRLVASKNEQVPGHNKKARDKPQVGLSRVLECLCNGKKVPHFQQNFKTGPKGAAKAIRPSLEYNAKENRVPGVYRENKVN
ncbi:hypothetical protein HID58_043404 [Brassica napus]|uniref:Uncharacterized protein n=1 Tax=Brassica napus TaxID=3708 RepID=A0ABQ8BGE7_BRANA|nr:hypothetical protein HID58_043404 [Brassica napus]